ncbi:MAG: hypothetical protein NDI69_02940 [Bacteriovoracaceae bacterium]|nr:hypothetical protein [Bacteriovoracaceae bacterium]
MKKFFSILIKILPLLTLYKGITSGGARLGPFVDTIKVALTQYEVGQITKLTYDDYGRNRKIVSSVEFPQFIKDNFHSQYSVLAREINGDKGHDHSKDIWGNGFQLILNQNIGQARIASAGPDGIISNKDDIGFDFSVDIPQIRRPAAIPKAAPVQEVVEVAEVEQEPEPEQEALGAEYDEEGYDSYGFNREGYDRDGYDQNGFHRGEKETQYAEAEIGP